MMLLALVALLLYGGDLPQVARSWGKSFAEFRRGLSGIQRDLNDAIYSEPQRLEYHPPRTGEPASAGGPSKTETPAPEADANPRD